jgi:hypothetical protein
MCSWMTDERPGLRVEELAVFRAVVLDLMQPLAGLRAAYQFWLGGTE